jgi:hypothetical protein
MILLIASFQNCYSQTNNQVWKNIFKPISNIRDLSFELHTNELENLINQKMLNKEIKDIHIKYFWLKDKSDLQIQSSSEVKEEIIISIKEFFKKKLDIITGSNFKKYINGYELKSTDKGWVKYFDPTGLKDITYISIKRNSKSILIIEKKSIGTTRTTYNFKKEKWSKNEFVIYQVVHKVYEGVQSTEVKTDILYNKIDDYWLPSVLNVSTIQKVNKNENEDYSRQINEKFEFKNFQINKTKALQWFATH